MQTDFFSRVAQMRSRYGPIFEVPLGLGSAVYIGDAAAAKQLLTNTGAYDKGLLGTISGDIFGKGLITALDRDVWRRRRRAVAPSLTGNSWLNDVVSDFDAVARRAENLLDKAAESGEPIDMEAKSQSISLDVVGKAVFGFEFDAVNSESDPVIAATYRVLKETSYRSEKPSAVAWSLAPTVLAKAFSPEFREFKQCAAVLDSTLNKLISSLRAAEEEGLASVADEAAANMDDVTTAVRAPSVLRLLVEVRDDASAQQLKDDLVTLLIAGHETVASVLTWVLYELARHPSELEAVQSEVDALLASRCNGEHGIDSPLTMADVLALQQTRRALAEALRLYPAPPLLSRRTLQDDVLPLAAGGKVQLRRGTNIFLLTAMLHRDPRTWGEDADCFRLGRWDPTDGFTSQPTKASHNLPNWRGFSAEKLQRGSLYPSEQATDYAYVPFGGGEFKCLGDKFAFLEATVVLARLLHRYEFQLVTADVGFDMAATIHTSNGLWMKLRRRDI